MVAASRAPPATGPMNRPRLNWTLLRVLALKRVSRATRKGMAETQAGMKMA